MFTIYRRSVNGNAYDRYYEGWENAKQEMFCDIERLVSLGGEKIFSIDRFNAEKGLYELEYELERNGIVYKFALIDGYFEDV